MVVEPSQWPGFSAFFGRLDVAPLWLIWFELISHLLAPQALHIQPDLFPQIHARYRITLVYFASRSLDFSYVHASSDSKTHIQVLIFQKT